LDHVVLLCSVEYPIPAESRVGRDRAIAQCPASLTSTPKGPAREAVAGPTPTDIPTIRVTPLPVRSLDIGRTLPNSLV